MPAHLIAEEGPLRGLVLNLEEGQEWILGRDATGCDFYLEDSTVSRRHAQLNRTDEGIYLQNLSRVNPTLVNDEELPTAVLLKEGDRIHIGSTTFVYSEGEAPQSTVAPQEQASMSSEMPPKPEPAPYDSIFEDTGAGDEEIAFDESADSSLMLKVVAGPNAGAEIGVEKGRDYTIGKDAESCDIVFQDLSVSRQHAKLSITEDGMMRIEDLDSKNGVAVNGALITQPTGITSQDMVALGTTVFMVIDREAPQETIYSPITPSLESTPETPAEEEKEEELLPTPAPIDWKKERIEGKYLIAGGSAVAIFLIAFLSFFSLFKTEGMEKPEKESLSPIKEALAKFPGVQYSFNPGSGKIFIVGHVLTGVEYQEMQYRLGQIPFLTSIEESVVIDEGVSRTMNEVLSTNGAWRGISIQATAPGKFAVTGYVPNEAAMIALSEYLTMNFPYLDLLQNRVVVEDALQLQLQALLIGKGLGAVQMQAAMGHVILSGRYSEAKSSEYEHLVKTIERIPGVNSVKDFAVAVSPKMAGVDLTAQYQVSGTSLRDGKVFSVVVNGRIYAVGDFVDGMQVTDLSPDMVLLEKDGLKYRIDYTL